MTGKRWVTADGLWRVTRVELDGIPRLRAETRGVLGWIWRGDFPSLALAQAAVPGELREARP